MEVVDGNLLGFRTSGEAIVLRNSSEVKKYGCSNESEMMLSLKRIFRLFVGVQRCKEKRIPPKNNPYYITLFVHEMQ